MARSPRNKRANETRRASSGDTAGFGSSWTLLLYALELGVEPGREHSLNISIGVPAVVRSKMMNRRHFMGTAGGMTLLGSNAATTAKKSIIELRYIRMRNNVD